MIGTAIGFYILAVLIPPIQGSERIVPPAHPSGAVGTGVAVLGGRVADAVTGGGHLTIEQRHSEPTNPSSIVPIDEPDQLSDDSSSTAEGIGQRIARPILVSGGVLFAGLSILLLIGRALIRRGRPPEEGGRGQLQETATVALATPTLDKAVDVR